VSQGTSLPSNKMESGKTKIDNVREQANRPVIASINPRADNANQLPVRQEFQITEARGKEKVAEPLKEMNKLPLLSIGKLTVPAIDDTHSTKVEIKEQSTNDFFIVAGAGYTIWQFTLNDAFASAVEAAAFENSRGEGVSTFLEFGKQVNKKFGLSAQVNYQKIDFSSGHNSTVEVDNTLVSQTHNLTMATPLGFIDNEIILRRLEDSSSQTETLEIDLHNDHTIQAVELNLLANFQVVERGGFTIGLQTGMGVNQIVSTSNELIELNTNNVDYSRSSSMNKGDFVGLKKTAPVVSLNVNLSKTFSDNFEFGLQISGKRNLSPIQESGALKTSVQNIGLNATIRKSF